MTDSDSKQPIVTGSNNTDERTERPGCLYRAWVCFYTSAFLSVVVFVIGALFRYDVAISKGVSYYAGFGILVFVVMMILTSIRAR